MAKLYFRKHDGTLSRLDFNGLLSDGETSVNDNFWTTINISTSDYNNFVSYTKDFVVNSDNTLIWSDTSAAKDQSGNDMTQTEEMYQASIDGIKNAINSYKELSWNANKLTQINNYLSELDAIDTSAITFPISGSMEKDIASRCPNSIHPQSLNIDTTSS